jgi:hypothetical protein
MLSLLRVRLGGDGPATNFLHPLVRTRLDVFRQVLGAKNGEQAWRTPNQNWSTSIRLGQQRENRLVGTRPARAVSISRIQSGTG